MNESLLPGGRMRMRVRARMRGSMLVLCAGLMLVLTGIAILAFDVGRIYIVRNELQNAADAAALAGANCLTRDSDPASASNCLATIPGSLNWSRAAARAAAQLAQNTADNLALSATDAGHVVEVGYWNLMTKSPSGGSFSPTFSPVTLYDKPAVRVSVRKEGGVNNGPMALLTQLIYGGSGGMPMAAQAVAVISSPSLVFPDALVPQVINKCMYDQFWNAATGKPVIYTGNPPDPYGISVVGQPWELRIGSAYHYGACTAGQWTSFDQDVNSQSAVADLIANGNPVALGIGDMTWIEPGTKTASYNDLDAKYPTPPGADVTVAVVDTADLTNKGRAPIVAFAGFHISDVQGGSGKYIQGRFIPSTVAPGSGIGPFYGSYTPPRLAF